MGGARGPKGSLGPNSAIPDKLYFKIGEVARLVGVEPHVLRYWEREIAAIRPGKSASNQRRYRYRDVEIFRDLKRLLYEERYTLAGARRRVLAREPLDSEVPNEETSELGLAPPSDPVADEGRATEVSGTSVRVPAGGFAIIPRPATMLLQPSLVAPAALDEELGRRLRHELKELLQLTGEDS